jgi:pyochelin biosynthetic protein PchC
VTIATATQVWLRRLHPAVGTRLRLVCFPHAGGTASYFRPWRHAVPSGVELHAVQYPGRLDRVGDPCVVDMDTMAAGIADAVAPLTGVPVVFFGHSLGAVVAYEVACALAERGGPLPARVFVSGRPAPHRQRPDALHLASDDDLWADVQRLGGTSTALLDDPELRKLVMPTLRADYTLSETYRPRPVPPLDCPVTAVLGDADPEVDEEEAAGWQRYTRGGFSLRVFPGDHFYLIPRMSDLLAELVRGVPYAGVRLDPAWAGP